MLGLNDRATVFTAAEDGSGYTNLLKTGVKCRLLTVPSLTSEGGGREEKVLEKPLLIDPLVTLPNDCQLEITGERWNVVPNTLEAVKGPAGTVMYRRCNVVYANRQADA